MKVTLVPQIEIRNRHPKGIGTATDGEYARIATEILKTIAKLGIADIPAEGLKAIAVNVTMYFEDILSETGIWRGFMAGLKERYGRRMPFYDIDEENYFEDEPNLEDVRMIVWYTMLEVHEGKIGNPENPVLEKLAVAALSVLDKHFETAPANEELRAYLHDHERLSDFYLMRDMLKWLCFGCYLTYIPCLSERLFESAQEMVREANMGIDQAFYQAESLMPYSEEIGPLNVLPQEWLGMILRAVGEEEFAQKVESQRMKKYQIYKVVSAETGKRITFEGVDGEQFTVTASELNNPGDECYSHKCALGSFVEYNGTWHLNGNSMWGNALDGYETMRADHIGQEKLHDVYDKIVAENEGSRLFYFSGTEELKKFLLDKLPMDDKVRKDFSLPEGQKYIVLYVPEDYGDFEIFPDGAMNIKDPRNAYYNEKWARNQALNFALSVEQGMRTYLISNGLLPDATINSTKGLQRGNEIVQQNFDFLTRAVVSRL